MATTTQTTQATAALNLIRISQKSQLALIQYLKQCKMLSYQNWNIRESMRYVDLAYSREADYTAENAKARTANRFGNSNKIQNITVPIVMPQVEAAVTYQSSVFLTGTPIFGVVSSPDEISQAKQLETLIDYQAIKGGWNRHFMMWFRDGFKYNISAMECAWEKQMIPAVTTNLKNITNNSVQIQNLAWEGNILRRLDPYNTFWDVRYPLAEVSSSGEFAGYDKLISRVEFKQWLASTPYIISQNIQAALEAPTVGITIGSDYMSQNYYVPQVSQLQMLNPLIANQFNWLAWSGMEKEGKILDYKNIYQKTTLYARLIPSDFDINAPAPNTPQIWKLIIINNYVVIYAQPCSLAYDALPILFGQPNEDGLMYQTKSLAQNANEFQVVTSAMMNSVIASRRRAVSDRTLYDPSRVSEAHINSDNPSAKIPIRPAAYGKPVSEAVYAFPYRDEQSMQIMQQIPQYIAMANQLNGQNPAKQGQFVKGNKTEREYDSVMSNANGRDQLIAMSYEAQFFTPLKEMLKINCLQFQTPATVYSREFNEPVSVDPVELRKASLSFKVSDGLIPSEKLIKGDALGAALNAIGTTPSIQAGYNVAPMFSYLMKSQGANLEDFEKSPQQMAFEQAMGAWSQTVQSIVQMMIKAGQTPDPKAFPVQPTPQAYGYVPGAPVPEASDSGVSIMSQWKQGEKAEADASQAPAPQQVQ